MNIAENLVNGRETCITDIAAIQAVTTVVWIHVCLWGTHGVCDVQDGLLHGIHSEGREAGSRRIAEGRGLLATSQESAGSQEECRSH